MNRVMRSLSDMRVVVVYVFTVTLICGCHGDQKDDTDAYLSRFIADLWLEGADVIKIIWRDCSKKVSMLILLDRVLNYKINLSWWLINPFGLFFMAITSVK